MNAIELKTSLHKILEEIKDEHLLMSLYDFLNIRKKEQTGRLWNSLSDEQKEEVFLAYGESESDDNLISREEFFRNVQ